MHIVIGADHGGFALKETVAASLRAEGHDILNVGAYDDSPSDYPDFALKVGKAVLEGRAERGILICGSGVGACVAANKLPGIRAALIHDTFSAHQGVEDDDLNVMCLGARVIGPQLALEIVRVWLAARFSGAERHLRRVGKVKSIEERFTKTQE